MGYFERGRTRLTSREVRRFTRSVSALARFLPASGQPAARSFINTYTHERYVMSRRTCIILRFLYDSVRSCAVLRFLVALRCSRFTRAHGYGANGVQQQEGCRVQLRERGRRDCPGGGHVLVVSRYMKTHLNERPMCWSVSGVYLSCGGAFATAASDGNECLSSISLFSEKGAPKIFCSKTPYMVKTAERCVLALARK